MAATGQARAVSVRRALVFVQIGSTTDASSLGSCWRTSRTLPASRLGCRC